ncbi:MAG: SDR family oxidoreductase [Elusimicrobia bacterium]|nr:SDR family oxidoreductase [Elusimicrobiota bacterium]
MPHLKNILVIGGAGHVGCALAPKLLEAGYRVRIYDALYFGREGLPSDANLEVLHGDVRDITAVTKAVQGIQAVIHLACISNDPSFELDPSLAKSINYDCFEPAVLACKAAGIERFIYASSSSVYGVSDAPEVREDHPLNPLTDYSKYKGLCEEVLRRHMSERFPVTIIRPATACGYSPRMRLDLAVNLLTNLAVSRRRITVFGGGQMRPNLHVEDMGELYVRLLREPLKKIAGQTFNAGGPNHTVADLARMVKRVVEREFPDKASIAIETSPSDDLRSYHVCSEKIARTIGFVPRRTVEQAIGSVCAAFKAGKLPDSMTDDRYYNVRVMKTLCGREKA